MTWRQELVCRILLLIAKMVAGDPELTKELGHLDSHIRVGSASWRKEAER